MNDSAGESENDLEEGIPEELEEDSKEDLRENCDENISSICSKLSVSSSENLEKPDRSSSEKSLEEESSSSFSKIVFTIPKDKNSGGSAVHSSEPKRLINLRIDESFFHLIPGSEEEISCASESHILQTADTAVVLRKETSRNTTPVNAEDQGNFMFMYHGSEDDLNEEVTRHSGGSDASQEDVLSPVEKSTTPNMSIENLIQCHIYSHPPRKASLHSSCSLKSNVMKRETAGSCKQSWSDTACSSKYSKIPVNANTHDVQHSQSCSEILSQAELNYAESIAVVEESLLQEIEECLLKYFEATSSEEERFESKLSQLICNEPPKESNEEESTVEEESQESLDIESCDVCCDSDSEDELEDDSADDSENDSEDDSEENEEKQLKVCLKKGCTNIQCKKKKKKVFFLCNTEDYQKLLKEEEDDEICNKDDASRRK